MVWTTLFLREFINMLTCLLFVSLIKLNHRLMSVSVELIESREHKQLHGLYLVWRPIAGWLHEVTTNSAMRENISPPTKLLYNQYILNYRKFSGKHAHPHTLSLSFSPLVLLLFGSLKIWAIISYQLCLIDLLFVCRQVLDEVEIRELLIDYVGHRCCWGSRPARTWKIQKVEDCNVYIGTLETFAEEREVVKVREPYVDGKIDGQDSGPQIGLWELDLRSQFPVLFIPYKEAAVKIPHSEAIEKCSGNDIPLFNFLFEVA